MDVRCGPQPLEHVRKLKLLHFLEQGGSAVNERGVGEPLPLQTTVIAAK